VPALLVAVPLLMALLYAVDLSLAKLEREEVRLEAHNHFTEGNDELLRGNAHAAIEPLREAFVLERNNRGYALALAAARISDGQIEPARLILDDLLDKDPDNAQANLLMARLSAAQSRFTLADSFYHRAIYGKWDADADQRRLNVRLELAGLLAEHGSEDQLLAEILILQNSAPGSVELTRRIASLYLEAKSAARAVAAYRTILREVPEDAEAYAGLAEAEMLLNNFQLAQSAYSDALRRRPNEAAWQRKAKLADELAEIDPTLRRLSSSERFKRSMAILLMAERTVIACFSDGAIPPNLQTLLDKSRQLKDQAPSAAKMGEQAEARLEAAEELFAAGSRRCSDSSAKDDALALLMRKLSAGS
jgi:tetratricopeptide (TPR) repeat protein